MPARWHGPTAATGPEVVTCVPPGPGGALTQNGPGARTNDVRHIPGLPPRLPENPALMMGARERVICILN